MRALWGAAIGVLACGLFAGCAAAQTSAERAACKSDYYKFCPDVKPGGGRPLTCLAKYKDQLTPDCQKVVAAHSH
jgi:hypothetical protein